LGNNTVTSGRASMTDFTITLSDDRLDSDGDVVALGFLTIGQFHESFHASLSYWDRERYLLQWREALERLIEGEDRSALVTSMYDPGAAGYIFWWPLYAVGDSIHVQNHVLFLNDLVEPFDEAELYRFVRERETVSEDGQAISEWTVALSVIETFLRLPTLTVR
jgi:hypothetical protein